MNLVAGVKLNGDFEPLKRLLEAVNAASNDVVKVAFETKTFNHFRMK